MSRTVELLATITAMLMHCAVSAAAQPEWQPTLNVEIVVGRAPGGAADNTARTILRILQERRLLDVTATIVNRPGGAGAVGWAYLNQHTGNGHYLSISVLDFLTNNILGVSAQKHTDFTPLCQLFSEYLVFAVAGDSPVANGRSLVELYKREPANMTVAISPSIGGAAHIALALVLKAGGADPKALRTVVFNSGGEGTTAVMGGHVTMVVTSLSTVSGQMAAGKVRAIGISAPQRLVGVFAKIPTWVEQGLNAVFENWRGVIGPKGMTNAQVSYWEGVLKEVTRTEEWRKDLEQNSWADNYMGSQDSRKFLDQQYAQLAQIMSEIGLAKR
jgi:putative tricarboxylic transport membrane protein